MLRAAVTSGAVTSQYVDIRIDGSYCAKLLLMKSSSAKAFAVVGENCRLGKEDCNETDEV